MSAPSPGMRTGRSVTPINIYFDKPGLSHVVAGKIDKDLCFDGANDVTSELREGTIMARVTGTKVWGPCLRTAVTSNGGGTAQAIPVVDARFFQAGMEISVGSDTGKTIASVNYDTNTITIEDSAFTFANNEAVVATKYPDGVTTCVGMEIARGVLGEVIDAYDHNRRANVDRHTGKIVDQGNLLYDNLRGSKVAILAASHNLDNILFYDDGVWVG